MAWDVLSGVTKTAWDVMSGVTKTAWDVMSGVANLCGMFCPGWQKMAWDVLSRDVLSIETHITCDFPGGSGPPVPPSGSALLISLSMMPFKMQTTLLLI